MNSYCIRIWTFCSFSFGIFVLAGHQQAAAQIEYAVQEQSKEKIQETDKPVVEAVAASVENSDANASKEVREIVESLDDEPMIRFNFKNEDWKGVIEWFAKQGEFTVQYFDEPDLPPFTYNDAREYSVSDALDFLNYNLRLRGYALIRFQKMLTFIDTQKGIPKNLIDTVPTDKLGKRGRYEIMRSTFNIKGLGGEDFVTQIKNFVSAEHADQVVHVEATDTLIVQETGQKLRDIYGMIEEAKLISGSGGLEVDSISLEHINPEDAINIVRDILDIPPNATRNNDGTLRFSIDVVSNRIYMTGDIQKVNHFKHLLKTIDQKYTDEGDLNLEPVYVDSHAVRGDIQKVFKVLQTLLLGRPDVRLEFDDTQGTIIAQGRKSDHEYIQSIIDKLQSSSNGFLVIEPKDMTPTELMDQLEDIFATDEEGAVGGPKFIADKYRNRLIVRATPQEINLVRMMVDQLDRPSTDSLSDSNTSRLISLDEYETGRALDAVQELWSTLELDNEITIRPGDERVIKFNRNRQLFEVYGGRNHDNDPGILPLPNPDDESGDQPLDNTENQLPSLKSDQVPNDRDSNRSDKKTSSFRPSMFLTAALSELCLSGNMMMVSIQDQDETKNGTGQTSEEKHDQNDQDETTSDDQMTDDEEKKFQSVPGAPITVRVTQFGIVLESDDIDALLKVEDLIYDALGDAATLGAKPAAFRLNFRSASEIKKLLEEMMGISSSGGGGSGIGGLLGGAVSNAVGGAAGDLMGGLLGGGSSSGGGSGAIYVPESDVAMVADEKTNTLYVSATINDMDAIRMMVDELDRPDAPHDPNTVGENNVIYLEYRDPNEVADIIRTQYKDILKDSDAAGGANPQQAQLQMQQQIMRALTGGGRGGNNQRDPEAEKPKASLSVDEQQSALVVTGPRNLYLQIRALALMLDRPGPEADDLYEFYRPQVSPTLLIEGLKSAFGDKIVVETSDGSTINGANGTQGTPGATPNSRTSGNSGNRSTSTIQMPNQRSMQEFMQRMNQLRGNQQRGGQQSGNRGDRGGGNRGGGNRGQGGNR